MTTPLSVAPGSLPYPRTSLIGRETERVVARAALLDTAGPLLTLTGPGGVGKTRLALAMAEDVAGAFPDGVIWIDLAPLSDSALVLTTMVHACGLTPASSQSLAELLVWHLRARRVLLVVDNCEHVLPDAAAVLADLLVHCPALQILATSRAPLRLQAEQVLPVEPLAFPEHDAVLLDQLKVNPAVQLFVDRAQAVQPAMALDATNAPAIAAICRTLDGLPLALELAAARTAVLSPRALLTQMRGRLHLLRGGARDAPARHQTMREAIGWSYDLLTPMEQVLFRRLAVFGGGFTVDAAMRVASIDDATTIDIFDTLEALVAASLVRPDLRADEPRFTMLETIHAYAREQLDTGDEAPTMRGRHAAWALGLAQAAAPAIHFSSRPDQVGRLMAEQDNLRIALAWFADQGAYDDLAMLAGALFWFWWHRGTTREGQMWLERARHERHQLSPHVQMEILGPAAHIANQQGDHARATVLGEELRALAQDAGEQAYAAEALLVLSRAANQREDHAAASAIATDGIWHCRRHDEHAWLPWLLQRLGIEAHVAQDFARAETLFTEALDGFQATDNPLGTAYALANLGLTHLARGQPQRAARRYQASLLLRGRVEDPWETAALLSQVAILAMDGGMAEAAARLLGAATGFFGSTGTQPQTLYTALAYQTEARIRSALGPPAYIAAWESGRTLSFAQAIVEAQAVVEVVASREATSPPTTTADVTTLTVRERDVLELLVSGKTNPEIAEALCITRATVRTHVTNILGKLGVRSRTEAADYAHRHGLVTRHPA